MRSAIVAALLLEAKDFKLPRGSIQTTARKFKCSKKTVSRLWKLATYSLRSTGELPDFSHNGRSRTGRKKKDRDLQEQVKNVPLLRRKTLRSLAAALAVPKTSIIRALKAGEIRRHSNSVKPLLTTANQLERLDYCLSFVDAQTMAFDGMTNRIFVDEKWFYLTQSEQTYYLAADEAAPHRCVKSKRYITKVMFLAAVMRPVEVDGVVVFDGKLGIWPFVREEPAQRSSKNRPAGTLEVKPVSVDRDEYRDMLVQHAIPAIKEKVPTWMRSPKLIIQQDGAAAHVLEDDAVVAAACAEGGWDIAIEKQPPNSPDLNIVDLGFFVSIQSLQHEYAPRTIGELVDFTARAFYDLTPQKLSDTFLSLQLVMEAILRDFGRNQYKRPHVGKEKLRRCGILPANFSCCKTAYYAALAFQF